MLKRTIVCLSVVLTACALVEAGPTYTGTLSSVNGGLVGTGGWVADPAHPVTFSWTVTQNQDLSWHYQYEFNSTDLQGEISHLVLETSLNFESSDILNPSSEVAGGGPQWNSSANGNPNLPEPIFGIKFENISGEVFTLDFDSPRVPVWGDFFAKDGDQGGQLWNAGLTLVDPMAPPQNGSIDNHVLVPDSVVSTIPAPGALVLGSLGAGLICWMRRRRMF